MADLRVAIAHDWLTNQGGSERIVHLLHQTYPDAPIYTSTFEPRALPQFRNADVRTSSLQRWPLARRKHQLYSWARPVAFEKFDFRGYDVVISSSHAESKGIITPPSTLHVSYIHTPVRYYWSDYARYVADPGFGALNPLVRVAMPRMISRLRQWDFAAAQRPDVLVANSSYVVDRIRKYYRRDATVIAPPVALHRFRADATREPFFLVVSRLIPYKRVDLAVEACRQLDLPLVVLGEGSERARLERLAGPRTTFVGAFTDEQAASYYSRARAFLFPAEEDFGITPLEAMASGTPVIAFGTGGATETVVDGETGLFFARQTVESLVDALGRFESTDLQPAVARRRAEEFSEERFVLAMGDLIEREYDRLRQGLGRA